MSVLTGCEIEERLNKGEIFKGGSWDPRCIRGAAYDLRIAPDFLITVDGTRYWPSSPDGNEQFPGQIVLKPGEVAFVSSVEQVCMPLELSANIAQKFRLARCGLLVMGGLLVDPGYGMKLCSDGIWVPSEEDERLHFQLANIGSETRRLIPLRGSIAGIQFLPLEGSAAGGDDRAYEDRIPRSGPLIDEMFVHGDGEPLAPFDFFSRSRRLEETVERIDGEAWDQRAKLEATRRSTDQVIVFGVFLVSITLFTVAVAALVDALAGSSVKDVLDTGGTAELTWTAFVIAGAALMLVVGACWLMTRPVLEIVRQHGDESTSGGSREPFERRDDLSRQALGRRIGGVQTKSGDG